MTSNSEVRRNKSPKRGGIFLLVGAATLALTQSVPVAAWEPNGLAERLSAGPIAPDALRAAASDAAVRSFYNAHGWQPIWDARAASAMRAALDARGRHGLDRVAFLPAEAGDGAAAEVALTQAALRYAAALGRGLVDPAAAHEVYTLPRPEVDVAAGLREAVQAGRLKQWLDGLAPQGDEYRRLSDAYLRTVEEAATQAGAVIPDAGLIRVGDSDARVPQIVAALVASEYLFSAEAAGATRYTAKMGEGVKRLQRDYGIADDGVVGPATLEVLNLGPDDRARALAVALERARWLARTPPATRIDVNTAAAQLRYYRDGKLVDTRKVIVGKPGTETPMLGSPIFRLVANPTWTVPKSIERQELAALSAGELAARDMERRDGWIVQRSGPDNALGLVKFDMRNEHAIYLHDTNAPTLFDRSQRHLSHGCVRVDDALGFARRIAEEEGVLEEWERAQESGEQGFVSLPRQIPVRLIYANAFVDNGKVAFRTDPYGWNEAVSEALGFAKRAGRQARSEGGGLAP